MSSNDRPNWQLPPGVSKGTWDYTRMVSIASDYDDYFAHNSLFEHDQQVLQRSLQPPGLVADLGCGTGRALVPLVRAGHRGLAVDLSLHMLHIVQQKAQAEVLPIQCVRANLVQLDGLVDDCVDHAICLFSTLGMIRGRAHRQQVLGHVRRIVRPGGRFVLHVHNYWHNLRDPLGPGWLLRNLCTAPFTRGVEVGDKWFDYRGVPNMFLHVFRWSELASDLRRAKFRVLERIPLDTPRRHALRHRWLFPSLRANGWIVVCE